MGWASKFGAGFFQGAGQTLVPAYERGLARREEQEEAQAGTYLSVINATQTKQEALAALADFENQTGFKKMSRTAQERVRSAAVSVGGVRGLQETRAFESTLGDTASLVQSLEAFTSEDPEAYSQRSKQVSEQRQRMTALLQKNPALATDLTFQDQLEKLTTVEQQLETGARGARQRATGRKVATDLYGAQIEAGATPEALAATAQAAGLAPDVAALGTQTVQALAAKRARELAERKAEDERNYRQSVSLQEQSYRLRRRGDLSEQVLKFGPGLSPQQLRAIVEDPDADLHTKEHASFYLVGATGVPEVDSIADPTQRLVAFSALPEAQKKAIPDYEDKKATLVRLATTQQTVKKQVTKEALIDDIVRRALPQLMQEATIGGAVDAESGLSFGGKLDYDELGRGVERLVASLNQAGAFQAEDNGLVASLPDSVGELSAEYARLGGTPEAGQGLLQRIQNLATATPQEKMELINGFVRRHEELGPLAAPILQSLSAPEPGVDFGVKVAAGATGAALLGGAAAKGLGLFDAPPQQLQQIQQLQQFPWMPGAGERGVKTTPMFGAGTNPNAPPPVYQGSGAPAGAPPPAAPPPAAPGRAPEVTRQPGGVIQPSSSFESAPRTPAAAQEMAELSKQYGPQRVAEAAEAMKSSPIKTKLQAAMGRFGGTVGAVANITQILRIFDLRDQLGRDPNMEEIGLFLFGGVTAEELRARERKGGA